MSLIIIIIHFFPKFEEGGGIGAGITIHSDVASVNPSSYIIGAPGPRGNKLFRAYANIQNS